MSSSITSSASIGLSSRMRTSSGMLAAIKPYLGIPNLCDKFPKIIGPLRHPRQLVQQKPVETELPHGLVELLKVYRLNNIAVDSQLVTFNDVTLLPGRGEDNHRHKAGSRVAAHFCEDF